MVALTIGQYFVKAYVYNLLNLLDNNYIIGICTTNIFSLQAEYRILMQREVVTHDVKTFSLHQKPQC